MSYFVDDANNNTTLNHTLWAEKYRSINLTEYIASDELRNIIKQFIDRRDIPQLLFYGSPGCGKTTLAKLLSKSIPCDLLYVNASDNTGVDFIRDKIKPYAASAGFNDLKIIILDESDYLSINSQASLRNLMETYSQSTRFILTCNYVEKIIAPLISRCQIFKIEPPCKKDVAIHIKNILDVESIIYKPIDIKTIVDDFYPDIRKIINFSQQSSTSGTLNLIQNKCVNFDLKLKLVDLLKNSRSNPTAFTEIRQLINDSGTRTFEELYTTLYTKSEEYAIGKDISVILEISEHLYQDSLVVAKEITFMACISKLIKIINKP